MTIERPARIVVRGNTSAAPAAAWDLLTDWPAQSRWIPLTSVFRNDDRIGFGARFTGRTRIGPIWFDDPMEVISWQPPTPTTSGRCMVIKRGRWICGTAQIVVTPDIDRPGSTTVTWLESVRIAGIPAALNPLIRVGGGFLFRASLRKAIKELDRI